MKAFRFRLATVLKLREATRDERLASLAEAQAADDKLSSRRQAIQADIAQLNRLQQGRTATGQVNIDVLVSSSRYDSILRAELVAITAHQAKLAVEIEQRRQRVMAADREVRTLEKLRDKQLELYRQNESLHELKGLDEIATRQSWQKTQDSEQTSGFQESESFEETKS
jgi:flagellar protein FliJ